MVLLETHFPQAIDVLPLEQGHGAPTRPLFMHAPGCTNLAALVSPIAGVQRGLNRVSVGRPVSQSGSGAEYVPILTQKDSAAAFGGQRGWADWVRR